MVVEDDKDLGANVKAFLEYEGFQVHLAKHGAEALEYLDSGQPSPDGIVLDLMMPVMDGWEFRAKQIVSKHRCIPVIVLTASGNTTKGIEVDVVLRKPVDLDLFVQTIQNVFYSKTPLK